MSKLTLSRALMGVAIATAMSSTYAAPRTENFTGTLAQWKAFNAAQKAPMPYANAVAGVDIFESSVVGQNKLTNYGSSFISVPVTGTVTFDSSSGVVTALTMSQTSPVSGYYDVSSDSITDDSYANSGAGGKVTFSSLEWTLETTGNSASGGTPYLAQTAGSADGCEAGAAQCSFTVSAVNTNDHANGLGQSIFDFQGVNANFQSLPKSNAAGTSYGTINKLWSALPGVSGLVVNLGSGALTLAVASRTNSGVIATNAGNTATFTLAVNNVIGGPDFDNDGIPDTQDPDDDNDGVRDVDEVACGSDPFDGASVPADLDSCAVDTDSDGVPDYRDIFPTDPDESKDTDADGIGNNADTDDDNDLVSDKKEALIGSNRLKKDTDGDGLNDNADPFPTKSATPVTNTTKVTKIQLTMPGCFKGVRVVGANLSFLSRDYNLSMTDGLAIFGKYTKSGKQYSLKPDTNSVILLKSDLTRWAKMVCGDTNARVTSVTFSQNVYVLNGQKTQGALTISANVNAIVKGKKTKGSYTVSGNLPVAKAK